MTIAQLVHLLFDDGFHLLVAVTEATYSSASSGIEELGSIFEENIATLSSNSFFWDETGIPMKNGTFGFYS